MTMSAFDRRPLSSVLPLAVSIVALAYAISGYWFEGRQSHVEILSGAWHAAELFGIGMLPVAAIVIYHALTRPSPSERRACLIGAAIAAIMLIPLSHLAL